MTVSGRVTYDFVPATYSPTTKSGTLVFTQATEKPVRSAVVQARQGSTVLATTNTDEQGNYQLNFTTTSSAAVTVVALAKTTSPAIQIEDNTDANAIWAVGETVTSGTTTKNLHATHGWMGTGYDSSRRSAAPFAILDSMYTAAKAFMDVRPVTFPALKVNWSPDNVPQPGDKSSGQIGTSHYAFLDKEIYVLGKAGVDADEFDSHVIVHEWGHYFEDNLSRADSPGGPHTSGDVLDPRIAFGEGYGNAIAAMLLPESVYTDTLWSENSTTPVAFGFDAETAPTPTDDPDPGAFSEMTVLRVLYDLYDSGTTESSYDSVALGLGPIYDVLTGPQKTTEGMTTIGSFIAGLKAQSGVNATAVNTLLSHYKIGPITTAFGDGDSRLRAMYTNVNAYPYTDSALKLGGGYDSNKWEQNQYYVFTGNGQRVTISANSTSDVAVAAYFKGEVMDQADENLSGTETITFVTQPDARYVLVVTGFEERNIEYPVTISIKSP
ncbi:hypothetical protein [Hyalangium versicolor]|uniref:hypothetical protein n=1 Tax=Hyalangium versicolor TaxID=2861190 RepID=UPI001CCB09AD|nr:hypothetical protein [Hyalangium versicolor]